jgi:hypothetical protein
MSSKILFEVSCQRDFFSTLVFFGFKTDLIIELFLYDIQYNSLITYFCLFIYFYQFFYICDFGRFQVLYFIIEWNGFSRSEMTVATTLRI